MTEPSEVARLWKIRRTMHELARDRVRRFVFILTRVLNTVVAGLPGLRRGNQHGPKFFQGRLLQQSWDR